MDTGDNDVVPVKCNSRLFALKNEVKLELYFWCQEFRGDLTTFEGTKTITVYTAPAGKNIVKIDAIGGLQHQSVGKTRGTNYQFNPFLDVTNTYWKKLTFRVDGKGEPDDPWVGVDGLLEFAVHIR